jgi:S-adenosylhomocysteine hydrolase
MEITDKEKLGKLYRLKDKIDKKIAKLKIEMRRKEFQEIINEKVVYKNETQKAYRG